MKKPQAIWRHPHGLDAEVVHQPDDEHRPADIRITGASGKPDHPPGCLPLGKVVRIEPAHGALAEEDANLDGGEEVNDDDRDVNGM